MGQSNVLTKRERKEGCSFLVEPVLSLNLSSFIYIATFKPDLASIHYNLYWFVL